MHTTRIVIVTAVLLSAAAAGAAAQPRQTLTTEEIERRWAIEKELNDVAIVERKLMVPMRDGVRIATDVYRPRNVDRAPIVFVRTPYNFNYWDVRNRVPRDLSAELDAVKRGYAFVEMNERGHFFSEGNYDILGPPISDGYDAIEWMAGQPWSNGKVGLIGCSSTAEWQSAVAAQAPPGLATIIPQGFGAGVGRVGGYYEQGNWYRGGAVQMLFISWLYGEQNQVRPMFPPETSQEDLVRASKSFDLAQQLPAVDWSQAFWHLPVMDLLKAVDGPRGIFADSMPVATGGAMIKRTPNDPAWYRGGLWHDDMKVNVPGLYFMSWYDVSTGPNLAQFNRVRKTADPGVADQQYAIIAPTLHCAYKRATENTVVGERSMGDARWNYDELTWGWFDHFLKGERSALLDTLPKVRYFTMGSNQWQSSDTWPPAGATPLTLYLASNGNANTLRGDGVLTNRPPATDYPDRFTYDPMNPVPSHGGNVCCQGNALSGGALDQRSIEERPDVLVYTTEPLEDGMEVSGPVELTVYVSSDRRDTDITVKLLDVYPDGTAYNLDETIQRLRYRNGYDQPLAWLEPQRVYKVTLQPMTTSNYFAAGHRIRIEVSSSNFPRFDRNLNTGGNNYDETSGLVAHNAVHHSSAYPSQLVLSVVRRPAGVLQQEPVQYRSPAGVEYRAQADTGAVARARRARDADPRNVDRIIDLAVAQSGVRQFREAIQTLTRGLAIAPNEPMLYRWRGHRYLSVREFDNALADLTRGSQLDSTNYGIWYHLGIVHFAQGDFPAAARAFARAQPIAPDAGELAGSTDWLWMSLARAGRKAEADAMLARRPDSLAVANAYAQRLKLYRGEIGPEQVITPADTADVALATLAYGVGNWFLVRGDTARARAWFERSVRSGGWPAFGFIMAEVEMRGRR